MKNNNIATTEFAVEINNADTNNFVRQIDTFKTYEQAVSYIENHSDCNDKEYYNIIFINYDKNGDEIEFGTVC